ncbi:hypothetical protein GCM10019016_089210 [Streptomyces prasinosporus]|uniref:Uncharacterized protein n=1 Tax=Streptomyces prasinosporus TaxID=68256 RepID=A0ABP6U584_9ACTN
MLAGRLEQVGDFEDVAGDLQVAVAVHGCGGSSAEKGEKAEKAEKAEKGAGAGRRVPGSRAVAGASRSERGSGGRAVAERWVARRRPERWGASRSGRSREGRAQQPEQQQLQRARAAPRDPAGRVEVSAEFASMPIRTPVHTTTVNSTPGMWDVVHLIRFISQVKGLL